MSHSPSSAGHGPPSSPYAGTDLTLYSPEAARKGHPQASSTGKYSIRTAGKMLVSDIMTAIETVVNGVEYKGLHPLPHTLGRFINELPNADKNFISRYVFVSAIPDGISAGQDHEMELYCVQRQMKLYRGFSRCVPVYNNGVHLRFDNIRDACAGKQLFESSGFEVSFINNYDFALAKAQDTLTINEFEGQIKVIVAIELTGQSHSSLKAPVPTFGIQNLVSLGDSFLHGMSTFGTVRTYVHTATDEKTMMLTFRVEFHSAEAATRAAASLNKDSLWDFIEDNAWRWSTVHAEEWASSRSLNSAHRYRPRIDDRGRNIQLIPFVQGNPDRNAGNQRPTDGHNRVRREHILDGTDVRTTIMLRNIPNKVDWLTLKALLDRICFGTFDFLYVRIDFDTGFNVGYAFINFTNTDGMIKMLDEVEHHGWAGYRSSKNAEISYATIQGLDALVGKFRNSSVMQETPFCRPRLFISYDESVERNNIRLAGVQKAFPAPDNLSKLQRSMDSARSIGLFPPSGTTNINGNRLVSGYDRGGPRDLLHAAKMSNWHNARSSAAEMTTETKRQCEHWYATKYGVCRFGKVPFAHIPIKFVTEFTDTLHREATITINNPGVIGRPVPVNHASVGPAYGIHGSVGPASGSVRGAPYGRYTFHGNASHSNAFNPRTSGGQASGSSRRI